MNVTIKTVAKVAGTSISTVSRVITGSAKVSDSKRIDVEKAIKELGYRPNQIAQSLKTKSTKTIGLLINDITNPFYSLVAKGAEDEANRNDYCMMLCHINEEPKKELQQLQMLYDKGVDGIIFGPTGENIEFISNLNEVMPIVQIDRKLKNLNASSVIVDNEEGAYKAVKLLISRGHQRIGALCWAAGVHTPKDRMNGYKRALEEANIPSDPDLIVSYPKFVPKNTDDLARKLINIKDRPSAIFALNNQLGIGAIRVIHEAKLKIPDEMAIVVFDDLDVFTLLDPPITAITQPALQMGRRAMQLVIESIKKPKDRIQETITLQTKLVIRGSS